MSSCVKCDDGVPMILIGTNGTFCKECFEKYFIHKFRASLGKHPIVRHGDRVVIAFSGGNNSSALLKLVTECLSPTAPKRLKFTAGVIFVDETSIIPVKDSDAKINHVELIMKESGLPYSIIKLEEVLNIEQPIQLSAKEQSDKISTLFNSLKTVTTKEELIYRLRCKLLAYKASALGYHHVFLGESSSRLAINILSNIAQGHGAHLPLDTRFTDQSRYCIIDMLRPMRDMTSKEIAVYNAIHNVQTVFFPTFSTKLPSSSSIQRLTEDFILSLSTNFPSTETTVYRTSNKLQISSEKESSNMGKSCSLCYGPIDTDTEATHASALNALNFTECLSAGELGCPESPKVIGHLCRQNLETDALIDQLNPSVQFAAGTNVLADLCHACKILYKDLSKGADFADSNQVFHQLINATAKKLTEDEMREKLEGILIDS